MKKPEPPTVERYARPKTLGEARILVLAIYAAQPWDEGEAAKYEASLGLEPKHVSEREIEELRTILADFEASRMIHFLTKK